MEPIEARGLRWGIDPSYWSARGELVHVPPATIERFVEVMAGRDGVLGDRHPAVDPAADPAAGGPPDRGPMVVHPGERHEVPGSGVLVAEDGREQSIHDRLPPDLPLGYHHLYLEGAEPVRVIVSPGRAASPGARRLWGWAMQLYAVRSRSSWGIGDLGDLKDLVRWSDGTLGSGFTLLNPLHAPLPGLPQEASPYFPSSRRYRNPLYIRIEDVPGASESGIDLDGLARAGRELNTAREIDRDAVWRLKEEALDSLWEAFLAAGPASPLARELAAWREQEGPGIDTYGTFCALAEDLGRGWQTWPSRYRHPGEEAVEEYRVANAERVDRHVWLQWLVDRQLRAAEAGHTIVGDIAVGCDPEGADAWAYQDVLAFDASVGAPPDDFNTRGQDWGAPPFVPWALRSAGYQPFIDLLRGGLRPGGGIRLDHVMGLFRLFWLPRGQSPEQGAYVRYPAADLLDIVALESHRAGAFVVGEDLGTVEDGVRDELARRGILSYKLLWFEPDAASWPEQAMGAVTTHDLPTIAGLWSGADIDDQRRAGVEPNEAGAATHRELLRELAGADGEPGVAGVIAGAYEALGRAPAQLLTATLEDALGVEERPNVPGTTVERPNWSLALPATVEELAEHPGPRTIAAALRRDR